MNKIYTMHRVYTTNGKEIPFFDENAYVLRFFDTGLFFQETYINCV